jgi:hypothetical protein
VAHNVVIDAVWLPDEAGERAPTETAWARRFLGALRPAGAPGVYVNFLDSDDDSGRVREAYGDRIHQRLAEVKATYDPDNAFHHNKNIRPIEPGASDERSAGRPSWTPPTTAGARTG